MPHVKYLIELTDADRKTLKDIVAKGTSLAKLTAFQSLLKRSRV